MDSLAIQKAVQKYLSSGKKITVLPASSVFSITEEMQECTALNARIDIPVFSVCLTNKQQGNAYSYEFE